MPSRRAVGPLRHVQALCVAPFFGAEGRGPHSQPARRPEDRVLPEHHGCSGRARLDVGPVRRQDGRGRKTAGRQAMSRSYWVIAVGLTLLTVGFSMAIYPRLPEQIPTHWNIKGEIDAYGSKQWAAFLLPGMMVLFLRLFRVLPWLSPKRLKRSARRTA